MGVALGFGLGIDFLQGNGPPGGLIQPPGQALPAVRQGLKIGQVHGPQASEDSPFIVLQRGRIAGFEPPGQNFLTEEGGGGKLRMGSPVVARPHPGNGKDLGRPVQPPGGLEVLHGQIVVGSGQTSGYVLTQQRVRCRLAAGGKGQALLQKAAQFRLEPPLSRQRDRAARAALSPLSLPKEIAWAPAARRIDIAPQANHSAEAQAHTVGSSSTRSAPPSRAERVRAHLSSMAQSPR